MHSTGENWSPQLEHAALSDTGLRRTSNQDSLVVAPAADAGAFQQRGHLFVVADGMGAHAAGELASKMAADIIPLTYHKLREQPPLLALRQSFETANEKIHSRGRANAEFHGMGTTASSLLLLPEGAVVSHVGDSRVYRARRGRIEQLSFDHSLAWEMTAGGQIRGQGVPIYIPKNIITRSLGPNAQVQVDLEGPFPVEPGDTFMLCSDGLTGQVEDAEIAAILTCLGPQEAVQLLVDLANLRGGPDNITVIVARTAGGSTEAARDESPVASSPAPGGGPWQSPLAVAVYLLAAAGLGVAGVALLVKQRFLQGFSAGGLAAMLLYLAFQQSRRRLTAPPVETAAAEGPVAMGRGPYTSADAEPFDAFAAKLAKIWEQLREASVNESWDIPWQSFDELEQQAAAAVQTQQYADAVRRYSQAISQLMIRLRQIRGRAEE